MQDGQVSFEWKDYASGNQTETMTLDAVEFIRRFLVHVLPSGFVHAGSQGTVSATEDQPARLCPACKTGRLIRIRVLSAAACACLAPPMVADTS